MKQIANVRSFGGEQRQYEHAANSTACTMRFSIFLPPQAASAKVPVLYWLSGLTCTDDNFVQKAGAQRVAAELGIAIVAPDTSPRGDGVPDDPDAAYDFGLGAGFYVNATQAPWRKHYQMYDYISSELPALVEKHCAVDPARSGISGHSMGGHGALVIGLRNAARFKSISAFSPISSPMKCPWGEKALGNYLGEDRDAWALYDACEQVKAHADGKQAVLVDQGEADNFLAEQLKSHLLAEAFAEAGRELTLRMQPGYDHSYFFIASFIEDHLRFHARELSD